MAGTATADTLRVATFAAPFSRAGPGLLLRDLVQDKDPQITAAVAVIAHAAPDILLLTEFDYDAAGAAAGALAKLLARAGADYPYRFALPPNAGLATRLDMDGDGRTGGAGDAQGYGRFFGDGGMLILSRWPIETDRVRDFSTLAWRDLPGAVLPQVDGAPFPSAAAQQVQRLAPVGLWAVPVTAPGGSLTLLTLDATPPVFDGPEDRNGLRNRDEVRFWLLYLDGAFGPPGPAPVVLGNANLDPIDGAGRHEAITALLADPRLQDPAPASAGAALAADPGQQGNPALDTVDWPGGATGDGPGNLRVSYVLPAANWRVTGAGVFWPAPDSPEAALLGRDGLAAGPHRLVWVDLRR
ncbi:endonuclease/exonuclease/phosphatase family protein [Limimaricola sp.]|uniref:endonuclease/exonuclease/phosphatase family protein n=1 Tax=Limimaricola sp. TaxID=2211665 RepID=UPI0025C53BAE|nr:endonuclease/exonuclease/phosphatase family protein [Limimaricola sp.]